MGRRVGQYDIVRATFEDGSNVPRIPPQRLGGGVYYRDGSWFARVGLLHAFAQNDVSVFETTTAGYQSAESRTQLCDQVARAIQRVVAVQGRHRRRQPLNEDVRNAVSFKKDEVLMPGRTVKVFASVKF